jgi:hypothetical protein
MNAKKNIVMLTMNANMFSDGELKFSGETNIIAAAAMSPTTAGLSAENMSLTAFDLLCFRINLLIVIIRMNGSQRILTDASKAPITAAHSG